VTGFQAAVWQAKSRKTIENKDGWMFAPFVPSTLSTLSLFERNNTLPRTALLILLSPSLSLSLSRTFLPLILLVRTSPLTLQTTTITDNKKMAATTPQAWSSLFDDTPSASPTSRLYTEEAIQNDDVNDPFPVTLTPSPPNCPTASFSGTSGCH